MILSTVCVSVLLGAVMLSGFRQMGPLDVMSLAFWAAMLPAGLLAGAVICLVRGYTITANAILVHRLFWDTQIPRRGLQSAAAEPGAFRGALRTWGNGGLFAFTGWYQSCVLGSFRAYATDGALSVVLRYADRTIVLTPRHPELFVRELSESAAAAEAGHTQTCAVPGRGPNL